jgi:hypothetical protein
LKISHVIFKTKEPLTVGVLHEEFIEFLVERGLSRCCGLPRPRRCKATRFRALGCRKQTREALRGERGAAVQPDTDFSLYAGAGEDPVNAHTRETSVHANEGADILDGGMRSFLEVAISFVTARDSS